MEFTAILGDRGSGKTNLLTAILKDEWDTYQRKPIADYHLKFPHVYMSFADFRKALQTDRELIRGRMIGFDEMSEGADSYEFFTKETKEITRFASQIRKLEAVCFYNDQRFGKVAKRLRDQTDKFMLMEDMDAHPWEDPRIHRKHCEGQFRVQRANEFGEPIGKPKVFDGKPYWNLYSTHEMIDGKSHEDSGELDDF